MVGRAETQGGPRSKAPIVVADVWGCGVPSGPISLSVPSVSPPCQVSGCVWFAESQMDE